MSRPQIVAATLLLLAACNGGPEEGSSSAGGTARLLTPPADVAPPEDPASYNPRPSGTLSFNEHIAPIVFENCTPCHRPGEAAPFAFTGYEDVRKRASQIVNVIFSGFMPPWLPVDGYNEFVGQRGLSADEMGMIRQWVREGAREGDAAMRPDPPHLTEGWQLGTPDLVVELPEPYTLRAGGGDVFRNFVVPDATAEDRYVRGMEFRPRNPDAVHHAEFRIDRSNASRRLDSEDAEPGYEGMDAAGAVMPDGHFLGWVPGKRPFTAADGMAWRLGADTDLVVQLHLLPSGKPEVLQPRIGFFFANAPPEIVPFVLRMGSRTMDIPAGESGYLVSDQYRLPVDVELHSVFPHAHYLGKEMKGWAELPDGSKKWLLRIDDWDFNWQDDFRYKEPIRLPRGTLLAMQYTFDNSAENVRNPHHPPKRVRFGPSTYDEMADLWLQIVVRDRSDMERLKADVGRRETRLQIERYRLLTERDPDDASAFNNLGHHYLVAGRLDDAQAAFRRAVEIDPGYGLARRNFAVTLYRRGQFEPAVAEFARSLALDPDDAEAHFTLGHMYFEQGRPSESIPHYRRAIEIRPDYAEAHFFLGSALEATGEPNRALDHLLRTVEIEPDWVVPLRASAWLLATHPQRDRRDAVEATRLAEHAAELTSYRDPTVLEALAAARAEQGDFAGAIETAERALAGATGPRARQVAARVRGQIERYRQGLTAVD